MSCALLLTGLKGALFLESLPKQDWPDHIFYYKSPGEADSAHTRLEGNVGENSTLIEPSKFQVPADFDVIIALGWQYLVREYSNLVVLHDSILPRYRGFAPTATALIRGDTRLGVTAIRASSDFDEGEILAQQTVDIQYPITIEEAFGLLAKCYVACYRQIFEVESVDNIVGKQQDNSEATYSLWRDELDFMVDWKMSAKEIVRFVHASGYPYAGAITTLKSRKITVFDAQEADLVKFESIQTGKIWNIVSPNSAEVTCGSGLVRVFARWADGDESVVFKNLRLRLVSPVI